MLIDPLRRADLDGVLDLWERLVANGRVADPRFGPAPNARKMMRSMAEDSWLIQKPWPGCLVAEADRIVGFITLYAGKTSPVIDTPPTMLIGDIWVEPDWRGTGLGRRLVDDAVAAARAGGCERIEVGTLSRDHAAVRFWKHLGFGDWRVTLAL